MKLYDSMGPNPKLVRMFAAEKGFAFSDTVKVDLAGGENRREPYLSKNPSGQLPCVELDDGAFVAETIAICELIEELQPEPALVGSTPQERAETRQWVRRVEWKVVQPMGDGFRFAEGLPIFKDRIRTLPEAAAGLKQIGAKFAVTNFGISSGALKLLNHVHPDYVRVHGELVQSIHEDDQAFRKVREIAKAVAAMKAVSIATHVDDAVLLPLLWQAGVDLIQGSFLQEPGEGLNFDFVGEMF